MTDEEHHSNDEDADANGKRRRVQRACDNCRRKKIRCEGLLSDKGACNSCAANNQKCTFRDVIKRRAPPRSYVIALEARMERAELLIVQLMPTIDLITSIGPMPEVPREVKDREEGQGPSTSFQPSSIQERQEEHRKNALLYYKQPETLLGDSYRRKYSDSWISYTGSLQDEDCDEKVNEEEDANDIRFLLDKVSMNSFEANLNTSTTKRNEAREEIIYEIQAEEIPGREIPKTSLSRDANDIPLLYYGKSSPFQMIPLLNRTLKKEDGFGYFSAPSPNSLSTPALSDFGIPDGCSIDMSKVVFNWPAKEIEDFLIKIYFERVNPHYPIMNEVVFKKQLQTPNWKKGNNEVILMVLGVLAMASRYLTDVEIESMAQIPRYGEHWGHLLKCLLERNFIPINSKITYIQITLLCTIYVFAAPLGFRSFAWISLGLVVRLLQEMGAHRKFTAAHSNFTLLTEETYRRLWWSTYVLDRLMSSDKGRPVLIQDEDTDLDEILLVDDQYIYEASKKGVPAVQPQDKPSVYHGFLQIQRLTRIMGRALRTIYSTSKSKNDRNFREKKGDAHIVTEIDASLQEWLENVPQHLAYSPSENNTKWLVQSTRVFLTYYSIQVLVHRPFIQRYKMDSPLNFHSLAIVSNSSRSGIKILYQLANRGFIPLIGLEAVFRLFMFTSSLFLISCSAACKSYDVSSTLMIDVRRGMKALKKLEKTWRISKRFAKRLQRTFDIYDLTSDARLRFAQNTFHATAEGNHGDTMMQDVQKRSDTFSPQQSDIAHLNTTEVGMAESQPLLLSMITKLPVSTAELQNNFDGSPDSTWLKKDAKIFESPKSSFFSTSLPYPSVLTGAIVQAADKSDMKRPTFSHTQTEVHTASQINKHAEVLYGSSSSSSTHASLRGEQAMSLSEKSGLRSDVFFGGLTSLPTPEFEINFPISNEHYTGAEGSQRENRVSEESLHQQQHQQQVQMVAVDNNLNGNTSEIFHDMNNTNNRSNESLDILSSLASFWNDSDRMRMM